MRNIFYVSDKNDVYHPDNSSAKFTTVLHPSTLDYLPQGEIECAVKSITIDGSRDGYQSLALKGSLISSESISSATWDKILCMIHLEKDQIYTEFKNPTFYPTSKDFLSKATFELIDLENNQEPDLDNSIPTVIHIIVKQRPKRMKHPFQIHLDSSCQISKQYFPQNSNTDFTIKLPKRLTFKKNWSVALKSIDFSIDDITVNNCWIRATKDSHTLTKSIKNGQYTLKNLVSEMNKEMAAVVKFSLGEKEFTKYLYMTFLYDVDDVEFSQNLQKIFNLEPKIEITEEKSVRISKEPMTLNALHPRHILVCCDIVENSIVGDKQLPVLKLVTLDKEDKPVLHFDFEYNDYLQMKLKDFESIKIKLMNINGQPLQDDDSIPTRLQMVFINTNSA